jgi:hypothetical protein
VQKMKMREKRCVSGLNNRHKMSIATDIKCQLHLQGIDRKITFCASPFALFFRKLTMKNIYNNISSTPSGLDSFDALFRRLKPTATQLMPLQGMIPELSLYTHRFVHYIKYSICSHISSPPKRVEDINEKMSIATDIKCQLHLQSIDRKITFCASPFALF